MNELEHQSQHLIAGRLIVAQGTDRYSVVSPFTEEVIGSVPVPTATELRAAVGAARKAFDEGPWPRMSVAERAAALTRISDHLTANASAFESLFARESGTPIRVAPGLTRTARSVFDAHVTLAQTFPFRGGRMMGSAELSVVKEPVGVVLSIAPWNAPVPGISHSLAPALIAGCTVIIKPAAEVPLSIRFLAEAIEAAGLPEGVVSILPGDAEVGDFLISQPEIDKIAFTGSTAVGKHIMRTAADGLTRLTLELGGKGPAILCEDADIEGLSSTIVGSGLNLSGQVCAAQTRLLVPRRREAEYVDAIVGAVSTLRVGDPLDPTTDLGPLTTARHRERVEQYIEVGRSDGAQVAVGGGRPKEFERGWFVQPTVFVGVDNSMRVAREEIFGPVLVVIPYDDVDDAIKIANDSSYGLTGSVWSADVDNAVAIAHQLRLGQIHVNGFGTCPGQPFGGFKQSGIGRKGGPEGLEGYLETKLLQVHG